MLHPPLGAFRNPKSGCFLSSLLFPLIPELRSPTRSLSSLFIAESHAVVEYAEDDIHSSLPYLITILIGFILAMQTLACQHIIADKKALGTFHPVSYLEGGS